MPWLRPRSPSHPGGIPHTGISGIGRRLCNAYFHQSDVHGDTSSQRAAIREHSTSFNTRQRAGSWPGATPSLRQWQLRHLYGALTRGRYRTAPSARLHADGTRQGQWPLSDVLPQPCQRRGNRRQRGGHAGRHSRAKAERQSRTLPDSERCAGGDFALHTGTFAAVSLRPIRQTVSTCQCHRFK